MYRSAMCIKMLNILKARQRIVSKEELARELETNIRNISEYKKELEAAGYVIETISGRYGGYYLNDDCLLPTLRLAEKEKLALTSSVNYLKNRNDFLDYEAFFSASEKILCSMKNIQTLNSVYTQNHRVRTTKQILRMTSLIQEACMKQNMVTFEYSSYINKAFSLRTIQPYDLVNSEGQYYVVGYSITNKAFRMYKISDLRMRNLKMIEKRFNRDSSYKLSDYIGKSGVYKGSEQRVVLRIRGTLAIYVAEHEIGTDSIYKWDNDDLILTTTFDNDMSCDSFILSLQNNAVVVEPHEIKQRIKHKIKAMNEEYQNML